MSSTAINRPGAPAVTDPLYVSISVRVDLDDERGYEEAFSVEIPAADIRGDLQLAVQDAAMEVIAAITDPSRR